MCLEASCTGHSWGVGVFCKAILSRRISFIDMMAFSMRIANTQDSSLSNETLVQSLYKKSACLILPIESPPKTVAEARTSDLIG